MTIDDMKIIIQALSTKIIDTEIKTRAIGILLEEKGTLTAKEIEDKYNFVEDRDFEKLKKEIETLISEYAERAATAKK